MNRFDKLRQEKSEYSEEYLKSTEAIANECKRTAYVAKHASEIIADIDKEFENATKLSKTDIAFLFLAVGLQCCRQYLFTDFKSKDERPGDQEQAEKTPGKETFDPHDQKAREDAGLEERHHKLYNPTLQEIILHPVPFDANRYNGMFEKGQEPLKGYGKLKHRGATIGHDPVLGLIFGTANIATSTLTTWDMRSYHILSQLGKGDIFACNADTSKVFYYTRKKLLNDGIEGKEIVATSLIKEIIHLQSDIDSKDSLPLPMVNLIDDKLASELAKYGLDMANVKTVAEQATFSMLINAIIGMIHRLFYNEEKLSSDLYKFLLNQVDEDYTLLSPSIGGLYRKRILPTIKANIRNKKNKNEKTEMEIATENVYDQFHTLNYYCAFSELLVPYRKIEKFPYKKTSVTELPAADFEGTIYVLTDPNSASCSEYTLALLHYMSKNTNIKICQIGQNTNGAVFYFNPHSVLLPNSGGWLYLPTAINKSSNFTAAGFKGEGYGWFPDYWCTNQNIVNTLVNLSGDKELEKVLQGLEKSQL